MTGSFRTFTSLFNSCNYSRSDSHSESPMYSDDVNMETLHGLHCIGRHKSRYTPERPPLLHRQLMSVFVSAGLISAPGTPSSTDNYKHTNPWLQEIHAHTHTHTHTHHQHQKLSFKDEPKAFGTRVAPTVS